MTLMKTLRRSFVWLLCLVLCLGLAVTALAADNTGSEIRLAKVEGTVTVTSSTGKAYSTREDMKLYNGYVVSTEAASYAWITLDGTKAVKLDAGSSLELRRSGKELELNLISGQIFFNVTAPLKEEEKLNIRTSTMVTGVRGTFGWCSEYMTAILNGHAQLTITDLVSGLRTTLELYAGELTGVGEDEGEEKRSLTLEDIPGFVQVVLASDEDLLKQLADALPELDLSDLTMESAMERLEAEEQEYEELYELMMAALEERNQQDLVWGGSDGESEGGSEEEEDNDGGGTTQEYTITWNDDEGNLIDTTTVAEGAVPTHAAPTKEATEAYTYTFSSWSPTPTAATGDATYTAGFDETPREYTITWIIDGVSTTEQYAYDATPTHAEPTKDADEYNTYEFTGWEPAISAVTGEATYTALFESTPVLYDITWIVDGVSTTEQYAYGDTPTHDVPTKTGTNDVTYVFAGWTPALETVTGEATYEATFTAQYKIDAESTVFNATVTASVGGEAVSYAAAGANVTLTVTPETGFEYEALGITIFDSMDNEVEFNANTLSFEMPDSPVTVMLECSLIEYTITWNDDEGNLINTTTVAYGNPPTHDDPVKEDTAQYTYTFIGWFDGDATTYEAGVELPEVTGTATYSARFSESLREYTITWNDDQGGLINTTTVAYGTVPTHADPTKDSGTEDYIYEFAGWDETPVAVTGEATYQATFTTKYRIDTTTSVSNATVTAAVGGETATYAAEDAEVVLTVTPATGYGYEPADITIYDSIDTVDFNPNTLSFYMPASPVSVELECSLIDYTITANSSGNGTMNQPQATAQYDETVTVTVEWSATESVPRFTATWNNGTGDIELDVTENLNVDDVSGNGTGEYSFNMPAGNVTVNCVFEPVYPIYSNSDLNMNMIFSGVVQVNTEYYAPAGKEVTVNLTPRDNSVIANGAMPVVLYNDGTESAQVTAANGAFTFTMPDSTAFVDMYFVGLANLDAVDVQSYKVEFTSGGTTFVAASRENGGDPVINNDPLFVNRGATITVTITVPENIVVSNISVVNSNTMTMSDPTVTNVDNGKQYTYTLDMPNDLNSESYAEISITIEMGN